MKEQSFHIAYLFPGQGSQSVGMGKELSESYSIARETFLEADELLGFNLSKLAWEGPEEELNDTINTQPALLVHSVAVLRVLEEAYPDISPVYVAGHSMGEITSLVAARALSFPDALRLVRARGQLMKHAGEINPGGMAAILGLEIKAVENICLQAGTPDEPVQIANDNCPGQIVISGASSSLEKAMSLCIEAGAKKVIRLAVSIAAHSPLMAHAQAEFNEVVKLSPIVDPQIPVVGNVSADLLKTAEEIRADLQAQLRSRVRWTESIRFILSKGVDRFLELGNNAVLTGLLKRISREATCFSLSNPGDFFKLPAFL
jgi:[acyl-carrier-protein] S-malonyltransferase